MGLDGGTYVSRTDVLRRQSWALAQADGGANRSTRGGAVTDSATYRPPAMNGQLRRCTHDRFFSYFTAVVCSRPNAELSRTQLLRDEQRRQQ